MLIVKSYLFFNFVDIYFDYLYLFVFIYNKVFCVFLGWSEVVCFGWLVLWWMLWCMVCWEICIIFLCKCDVFVVLLWIVLGYYIF